jgi:ABC-type lipoprotein release transport system permease subunit
MLLTVGGIALCVVLMLFLLAVYRGVADGSVEYIRHNEADLWVLQGNATNILRGSSILSTGHGTILRSIPGVNSASPVFFLLSTIKHASQSATVYLTGYDPATGVGAPPALAEGRNIQNDSEIVIDQSFARRFHLNVSDSLRLKDEVLKVVGISTGTNMFVIQYAFVSLRRAQAQIGYPGLVSCYLVNLNRGHVARDVVQSIHDELPGLEVYDHQTFLQNNIREMQSGFLPLLYTIAAIGAVVLTTILTLILSISILERRKDLAVMKILGSPIGFLYRLIVEQSFQIATAGCLTAVILYFPVVLCVERLSPEVSTRSSVEQIIAVTVAVWGMSLLSSFFSMRRLRHIYPLEAFL